MKMLFVGIGVGIIIGIVLTMVIACCSISGDLSRKVDEWSKEE